MTQKYTTDEFIWTEPKRTEPKTITVTSVGILNFNKLGHNDTAPLHYPIHDETRRYSAIRFIRMIVMLVGWLVGR